jgi:primosomal protein N' (replication factor Y)
VYLRCVQEMLEADKGDGFPAQALVMVPEINLTPQLEERFVSRFARALARAPWCRCTAA